MKLADVIFSLLAVCIASAANAQEVNRDYEAFPQQPQAEEQHPLQYDMSGLHAVVVPSDEHFGAVAQSYKISGNTDISGVSTYIYKPFSLPFTITNLSRSYIGLMDVQSVSGNMQWRLGGLSLTGGLMANRYLYYGNTFSQYGVSGRLQYSVTPSLSVTLFADYYSSNPFISMAAYPYVPTTIYGGYMTLENRKFFIDVGVERRYNTIDRKMETVPIVTPGFKISKKLVLGLPFGDFAKYLFTDAVTKKQRPAVPPKRR